MMHLSEMFPPFPALRFEIPCEKDKKLSYQTLLPILQQFLIAPCKYLSSHPLVIMNGGGEMCVNMRVVS